MNREIKFRFRYSDGKNWLMQVYTLEQCLNGEPFEFLSDQPLLKGYKHIGEDQYTGLKDSKGTEIYEGDVVKASYEIMVHPEEGAPYGSEDFVEDIGEVIFEKGSFWVKDKCAIFCYDSYDGFEVIGNIHQ